MRRVGKILAGALLASLLQLAAAVALRTPRTRPLERLLWQDMHLAHEAFPQGVPSSFNWSRRPRVNLGANPEGFRALLGWGQLYPCAGDTAVPTVPVELRNLDTWILSRATARWTLAQASREVIGAAYREDYADNESVPAEAQTGPEGGTLVKMLPERNFHFWEATGRTEIDPTDIRAIAVTLRARTLSASPSPADAQECVVLSVGADYWQSKMSVWTSHGRTVRDVGIGRFKLVGSTWRLYTMTSASASLLRRNPLPYAATQRELR